MGSRLQPTITFFAIGLIGAGALISYALIYAHHWTVVVAGVFALWLIYLLQGTAYRPVILAETPSTSSLTQLRRASGRLAALVDQAPDALLSFDGSAIRAVNRAARQMFVTDDLIIDPPATLLATVQSMTVGTRHTIALERRGRVTNFSISIVDIIEDNMMCRLIWLINIEAELRAAESARLRQMLEILGHEIMNTIAPIVSLSSTAADLVRDDTAESRAQALDALGTLERRAQSVLTFTDSYRSYSRLPPPEIVNTSLLDTVKDLAILFKTHWQDHGIHLSTTLPSSDVLVRMDREQIVQALWAILQNAAEASLVQPPADRKIKLMVSHNGAALSFVIQDNGLGFNEADVHNAFQPFFTTKPDGCGIGLSLAREIFRAHGGEVTVSSGATVGAEVIATL